MRTAGSKRRVKLGIPSKPDDVRQCFVGHAVNLALGNSFIGVVELLCEKTPGMEHNNRKKLIPVSYVQSVALFSPGVPEKLRALWDDITNAIGSAYAYGHEEGTDLVRQLAGGNLTINDLNAETIGTKT